MENKPPIIAPPPTFFNQNQPNQTNTFNLLVKWTMKGYAIIAYLNRMLLGIVILISILFGEALNID